MSENAIIIIVNYHGVDDTLQMLDSISEPNITLEVLIVDNSNTEEDFKLLQATEFAISQDPNSRFQLTIIRLDENKGYANAVNCGLRYALTNQYRFPVVANNDLILESKAIEHLIRSAKKVNNLGLLSCIICQDPRQDRVWFAGGEVNPWTSKVKHHHWSESLTSVSRAEPLSESEFISGAFFCVSDEAVRSCGLMDETYFMYFEDVEFSLRMIRLGRKNLLVNKCLAYHKVGGSSGGAISSLSVYYRNRNRLRFAFCSGGWVKLLVCYFFVLTFEQLRIIRSSGLKNLRPFYSGILSARSIIRVEP